MRVHDSNNDKTYFRKQRRRYDQDRTPRSLTFSCYRRYQFLSKDRSRQWFVDALEAGRQRFPVDLWAWVLMPDHVHLLVSPREPGKIIGKFQGFVKERFARQAAHWLEENAPEWIPRISVVEGKRSRRRIWQPGGGYDRNVDQVKTLLSIIDYIHENPVRSQLVETAVDWEWSSARWYAGEEDVPLQMDRTLPMVEE